MTERMYEDIFSKRMDQEFFEGLRFVGGNTFRIDLQVIGNVVSKGGKTLSVYEGEEVLTSILERYGCNWQEDEDQTVDGDSRRPGRKKSRTNVSDLSW